MKPYAVLLLVSAFIIGVNWFDIASLYPSIALNLNLNAAGLGQISGGFLLGTGIAQVPAGIFSARKGPRASMVCGLLISAVSILLMSASSQFFELVLFRVLTGVGLAFALIPGIGFTALYFKEQSRGFAIGLYNVTWLVGGMFALFGETILATIVGWRLILSAGGLACLGMIVVLIFSPGQVERNYDSGTDFHFGAQDIKPILLNPLLLLIGSTLLAEAIMNNTIGSFIVFYLEKHFAASPTLAGTIAMSDPLFGIFASLTFGKIFDRSKHLGRLMLLIGIASSAALALLSVNSIYAATLGTITGGFFGSAGFIFGIAAVRNVLGSKNLEAQAVGASWVFTILLMGSFIGPVFFSFIAVTRGYSSGWIFSAGLSLVLLVPFAIYSGSRKSLFDYS